MTAGLPGEHQGRVVQREGSCDGGGCRPQAGSEEHVEHPRQGDQQRAVHLRLHDCSDEHAEREVNDGDQHRRPHGPSRVVDPGTRRQGNEASGGGHQGQAERRAQAAGNDGSGPLSGGGETPISRPGAGDLEEPGQTGQSRGRPPGGGRLDLAAVVALAPQELGEVGQRAAPHEDQDDRNDGEQDEVEGPAGVVEHRPPADQGGHCRHRGTVRPSRSSTSRSKRSWSVTKWLITTTLRPAARRSAVRSQKRK